MFFFRLVSVVEPFPMLSVEHSTHYTYLDTVGRPVITFHAKGLTDKHEGVIYVRLFAPSPGLLSSHDT